MKNDVFLDRLIDVYQGNFPKALFMDKAVVRNLSNIKQQMLSLQKDNYELKQEISYLKEQLSDQGKKLSETEKLRESLNMMTAERGKWLRKLKRAGIKHD